MKRIFYIALFAALLFSSCSKDGGSAPDPEPVVTELQIVDKNASASSKALLANLWISQKESAMFGHHDYPAYGVGWRDIEGESDVKSLCGDYPAVLSVDLAGIEKGSSLNGTGIAFDKLRQYIKNSYKAGGVTMLCWHQSNPLTGGNSWDNSKIIDKILIEGGEHNLKYKMWLDNVAAFLLSLKDDNGNLIPVLFRPLHEHTQSWSWWGSSACSDSEFVAFWQLIVKYLRDNKGVHNVLYVISPQMDSDYGAATNERLLFRWPGDEFVDIIGMDCYHGTNTNAFKSNLAYLSALSMRKKKPVGVTETGIPSGRQADYWTRQISAPLQGVLCSMVVMWRNESETHAYGPYRGDNSASDFLSMYNSKSLKFMKDLKQLYNMPEGIVVK